MPNPTHFCVFFFCIIRSAPLYGETRDGKIEFFSGESREQYLLEGLVVAGLVLCAAMSLVLMCYSLKIPFSLGRHVGVIFFLSVFIVFMQNIWDAYVDKTSWYSLKETLPEPAWHFLTSSVKKNSWLPKRLLRLCELFLSDDFKFTTEDWNKLGKKFQTLIVDYLNRQYSSMISTAGSKKDV